MNNEKYSLYLNEVRKNLIANLDCQISPDTTSGANLNSFAGPKGGQVNAPALPAYITSM